MVAAAASRWSPRQLPDGRGGGFWLTGVAPSRFTVPYDPRRMGRTARYAATLVAAIAVAFVVSACGTNHVGVPKSDPTYAADSVAAQLFNQRCGGCHTLSYAGTHGSGQNPRTYEAINGPNFDVRCERPAIRVLYAIENGGFSGAYMPQNVVVGKQARELANFVARYAGRQAPVQPNTTPCTQKNKSLLPLTGPLPQLSSSSSS
jgi:mono/diheme cytochrome c family protein